MLSDKNLYTRFIKRVKRNILDEVKLGENNKLYLISKRFFDNIDYYETNEINSDLFDTKKNDENDEKNSHEIPIFFNKFENDYKIFNYQWKKGLVYNVDYEYMDYLTSSRVIKMFKETNLILEHEVTIVNGKKEIDIYKNEKDNIIIDMYISNNRSSSFENSERFNFYFDSKMKLIELSSMIHFVVLTSLQSNIYEIIIIQDSEIKNKVTKDIIKSNCISKYYNETLKNLQKNFDTELKFKVFLNNYDKKSDDQEMILVDGQHLMSKGDLKRLKRKYNNAQGYINYNRIDNDSNDSDNRYSKKKYQNIRSSDLPVGTCGLRNLGNTCYLNSALQVLVHSPFIKQYFLSKAYTSDINKNNPLGYKGELSDQLYKIFDKIWNTHKSFYNPLKFKSYISSINEMYHGNEQHDSSEFLGYIIDSIHEDLNLIQKKPMTEPIKCFSQKIDNYKIGRDSWIIHLKRNYSIINSLFYGQFKSTLKCPDCPKISITFDPFQMLHIPIVRNLKRIIDIIMLEKNINIYRLKLKGNSNTLNKLFLKDIKEYVLKNIDKNPDDYFTIDFENCEVLNEEKMTFFEINAQLIKLSFIKKENINFNNQLKDDEGYITVKLNILNNLNVVWKFNKSSTLKDVNDKFLDFLKNELKIIEQELDGNENFEYSLYFSHKTYDLHQDLSTLLVIHDNYKGRNVYKTKISNTITIKNSLRIDCDFNYNQKKILINKFNHIIKNLSLVMDKRSQDDEILENQSKNLDSLLKKFSLPEILDENNTWYCNQCLGHKKAIKKIDIFKLPPILIIVLKKIKDVNNNKENDIKFNFIIDMSKYIYKNNEDINNVNNTEDSESNNLDTTRDYNIDVDEFVLNQKVESESLKNIPKVENNLLYELYGVINHVGSDNAGHYFSYIKMEGQWYEFNDSNVSKIDENKIVSSSAYILLYKNLS